MPTGGMPSGWLTELLSPPSFHCLPATFGNLQITFNEISPLWPEAKIPLSGHAIRVRYLSSIIAQDQCACLDLGLHRASADQYRGTLVNSKVLSWQERADGKMNRGKKIRRSDRQTEEDVPQRTEACTRWKPMRVWRKESETRENEWKPESKWKYGKKDGSVVDMLQSRGMSYLMQSYSNSSGGFLL